MTESDLRTILGTNIKRYRNIKGFSQAKLAEMLDISPNFISEIETGKRWLSSDTLVNFAEALEIEVHEFLKPQQAPADDISRFIQNYTEKAKTAASEAVIHCLDDLRKKHFPEPIKKKRKKS
jgi:transcriptional regulator with XRE-family HTH domain